MRSIAQLTAAVAVAAALVLTSATNLSAQEEQEETLRARWAVSLNAEAQSYMERGDEAFGDGRFAAARTHYQRAIDIIRGDGEFPSTALHRIAATYYFEGKHQTAAAQLDALAAEAATYGDIVTQVWAIADAAWILGKQGAKIDMENRLEKLRKLLRSPYLPYQVRSEIMSKRLGEATTILLIEPMQRP